MQAEEVRAEADATVARAHAQASEMVAEAKGEAEQIVTLGPMLKWSSAAPGRS